MSLPKLALNHLNLPARKPDALRQWYVDKLGFTCHGRFLWSRGSLLVFVEGEPLGSTTTHFGFRVDSLDDLRHWVQELRARGVSVGEIEGDERYSTVFVEDLEGNRFEIFFEPVPN
jgi:catechol 2,3-dioxygenase-like lactoylglutathione lyase family enzyme